MQLQELDLIQPTEENRYCVFPPDLEDDPGVFFHATKSTNFEAITNHGFRTAKELKSGDLESVSYSKRSSGCFAHLGCKVAEERVIFAVRFAKEDLNHVVDNPSDIHVYKKDIRPEIVAYVYIPTGFTIT